METKNSQEKNHGKLISVINPMSAIIEINHDIDLLENGSIGLFLSKNQKLAEFVILDDRVIANRRLGRCKITKFIENETSLSDKSKYPIQIKFLNKKAPDIPISVVDVGTNISSLSFLLSPEHLLEEGELVSIHNTNDSISFYQVVYADIVKEEQNNENIIQYVKVISGQLGSWIESNSSFEPVKWVAKPGELIYRVKNENVKYSLPSQNHIIGEIPKSNFPISINVNDLVTHNGVILGVTGSGKSYLAFNLIEGILEKGIKVLILDPTRQHFINLTKYNPTPIKNIDGLNTWLNSNNDNLLGVYQFAESTNIPKTCSEFSKAVFDYYVKNSDLKAGKNEPAKMCMIFEEAHALIPEFNLVEKTDSKYVNQTSKVFLQGRKFGLGGIFITQRTANITKTILNQCNTLFALQSFDQTSYDYFTNYMGNEYSRAISNLQTKHCIIVGKASSSKKPVLFKIKEFNHI